MEMAFGGGGTPVANRASKARRELPVTKSPESSAMTSPGRWTIDVRARARACARTCVCVPIRSGARTRTCNRSGLSLEYRLYTRLSKDPGIVESYLTFRGAPEFFDPPRAHAGRARARARCRARVIILLHGGTRAETNIVAGRTR